MLRLALVGVNLPRAGSPYMRSDPQKPRVLAIETSGRLGSVALGVAGEPIDAAAFSTEANHAVELLPAIERLTARQGWPADSIDQFYVSAGPGSFTGLRIGITVARTLAMAVGAKVVAVPTVDVLACNTQDLPDPPEHLAVVLDAKRKQVYTAVFRLDGGRYRKVVDACVVDPSDLLARTSRPLALLGEGVAYHRSALAAPEVIALDEELNRPRAEVVLRLGWELACSGQFADVKTLVPIYLRRPEAEDLWNAWHGGG
jgi:tRNA threonylcarbamoyladenosine biosynthesis protein TsaB